MQRARIRAYAQAKGLELLDVLRDNGASGKTLERPAVQLPARLRMTERSPRGCGRETSHGTVQHRQR